MNKSRVILPIMPTHGNGSITITAHYGAMPTADLVHFSINHGK
ncbi:MULTISPECIES: hypothetical protein [unclassified Moraxella]|nr:MULTISPECIES: hypothetical protein [unclassified Moraxella]